MLFSLLAGHWPAFASKKTSLRDAPSLAPADLSDNAELIVRLMGVSPQLALSVFLCL